MTFLLPNKVPSAQSSWLAKLSVVAQLLTLRGLCYRRYPQPRQVHFPGQEARAFHQGPARIPCGSARKSGCTWAFSVISSLPQQQEEEGHR